MINATKTNLKKYKIKAKVKQADALTIKAKNIATELPFGRNTKKQDLINLYTKFLKKLQEKQIKSNNHLPKHNQLQENHQTLQNKARIQNIHT